MATVGDYISAMRHALGKTPASGHDLYRTLTFAGRQLFSAHNWSFRTTTAAIDAVADQGWVDLPLDFGQIVSVSGNSETATRFVMVSEAEVDRRRELSESDASMTWAIAVSSRQVNSLTEPKKVLLVWPTPSTDAQWTLNLRYLRDFPTYTGAGDDNKYPPIDSDFEYALTLMAKCAAQEIENDGQSSFRDLANAELQRLRVADGMAQPMTSGWVGGVVPFRDPDSNPSVSQTFE